MTAECREPSLDERLDPRAEIFVGSEIIPESGAHYTFEATLKRGILGAPWSVATLVELADKRSEIHDIGYAATMDAARRAIERAKALRRQGPIDGAWPALPPSSDVTLEMIPGWQRRRDCLPRWWRIDRDDGFTVDLELALPLVTGEPVEALASVINPLGPDFYFWHASSGRTEHQGRAEALTDAVAQATACVVEHFLTAHCRLRLQRALLGGAAES